MHPADPDKAELVINGSSHPLALVRGTEGFPALDISKLLTDTNLLTLDNGYANTASCSSAVSYVDGEAGILRYRGYPIQQLARQATFLEVAYLLVTGSLPNQSQLENFVTAVKRHTLLNEEMKKLFDAFPAKAHPMGILASATAALSTFYEDYHNPRDPEAVSQSTRRLLAKLPTIAAFAYKKSVGQPYVYPDNQLDYPSNFLNMMFSVPTESYQVNPAVARALDIVLILHADHEQNCSTSTVRMVGSSQANLFSSVAAGMHALWGPLHGGANQAVIEMLGQIHADADDYKKYVAKAKDPADSFRLMGFGHRVYKNFDPRVQILKDVARELFAELGTDDPLLNVARELETVALSDEFFIERKLYPNVDFYSGIIFRAMGFPVRMFTVLFALGRLPGWVAQWKELIEDPATRLGRPRQVYVGEPERSLVPIAQRTGGEAPPTPLAT